MVVAITKQTDIPQQVLENLNTTVLLLDKTLCLRYINPAGEMLFAVSARRLLGMPYAEMLRYEEPIIPALQEALQTGHPFTRHELKVELLPNRDITVDFTVTPLDDGPQGPELLIEINQLDRLLRISRDENLVAQQSITQELLRGLAHEVKNPLGGLRGAAQLLAKQLQQDDLKEYTSVIIDEADRLLTLVNRLLAPNTMPKKSLINIHEVLEHVRGLVQAEAGAGLHITKDYDPSIPELELDPDQLTQAVLNIIRNASQALNNDGAINLRTRVLRKFTIGQVNHRLVACIEIIDNGPGVPEKIKDRIFFPMVSGCAEGTGLGLAISQSLIQQHGGLIECHSQPGNTVFSILLPVK